MCLFDSPRKTTYTSVFFCCYWICCSAVMPTNDMTTAELVDAYELPVDVTVTGGYYGKSEAESLSEGEPMSVDL